jgi:hypothetical protein
MTLFCIYSSRRQCLSMLCLVCFSFVCSIWLNNERIYSFFLFDLIKKEKTLSTQRVNYLHTNSSRFLFQILF